MTGQTGMGPGGRRGGDNTRRGANVKNRLAYKVLIEAAVMITGFLAGWSSDGITASVVMSVALGAGVALPVFRGRR
jgi:hypothetical protein